MLILTKKEEDFFYLLLKHQDEIIKASDIKEIIWDEALNDEKLRIFIKRLRLKFLDDAIN